MNLKAYYSSPIGWIEIQASHEAVTSLMFCDEPKSCEDGVRSPLSFASHFVQSTSGEGQGVRLLSRCVRQLDEYFSGQRIDFDVPVSQKGTSFQQTVWKALMDIPFGRTVSYGDVAKMIHHPKSVRAVGAANGRNKLWIIVPCHRVIGANGSLTGYAGGLERKKWLLAHEAKIVSGSKFHTLTGTRVSSWAKPYHLKLELETQNLKLET